HTRRGQVPRDPQHEIALSPWCGRLVLYSHSRPETIELNAIDMQNVTKTFDPVTAVDGLSLAVPEGCIFGFIGPNGSGKTTTLRMIMNIF
ncbi:MAG: ATP-binding cassette domain-containing protein, partial [bacterium]